MKQTLERNTVKEAQFADLKFAVPKNLPAQQGWFPVLHLSQH